MAYTFVEAAAAASANAIQYIDNLQTLTGV